MCILEIKREVENFYEEEFRDLKLEIENDIQVEIIDNSKFGDIGGRFNFSFVIFN